MELCLYRWYASCVEMQNLMLCKHAPYHMESVDNHISSRFLNFQVYDIFPVI